MKMVKKIVGISITAAIVFSMAACLTLGDIAGTGTPAGAGNTERSRAANISAGQSVQVSFTAENQRRWYRTTIPNSGVLIVFTTGSLDTILRVHDAQGRFIREDDDSGEGFNARLSVSGSAGAVIFIEALTFRGRTGNTTLHVQSGAATVTPPPAAPPPTVTPPSVEQFSPLTPLPNRRLTNEERNGWITNYRALGGHTQFELEIVRLVNVTRAEHGLSRVEIDNTLMMAARFYAQNMRQIGRLGHNLGPYATNPSASHGASENVARAFGGRLRWNGGNGAMHSGTPTPQSVVTMWMNSSGHRAYMLSPEHRFIGVGSVGPNPQYTYMFLSNQSSL